jgi:hypothetical protein
MNKICSFCKEEKSIDDFYLKQKNPPIFRSECKKCKNQLDWKRKIKKRGFSPVKKMTKYPEHLTKEEKNKLYYLNNKEKIDKSQLNFRIKNRERLKEYAKKYREENPEKAKESSKKSKTKHKEKVLKIKQKYQEYKSKTDPVWKMRRSISRDISKKIKKNKNSFLNFLNYSINDLKNHLEKQFEPWMNWENRGTYNPNTWKDDDLSTWTWNIDHIIPHSLFNYTSLEDEDFKKCWSLDNLRPYSAKQNILDGSYKIRHKRK